jgi:D-alanine-D-alanine ligase
MRIGIAYNLREDLDGGPGGPEDLAEEFDSPETIDALAAVLAGAGHAVLRLGAGRTFLERMLADPPELVLNIAEGLAGRSREAQVPAVCEMLGVPCTGSDPLTLAATLDKDVAKRLVASHGLATPRHLLVRTLDELPGGPSPGGLAFPLIVKPAWEGSSKGVRLASKVATPEALREQAAFVLSGYGGPAIVEEFCEGEEFTVGVIGNDPPRVVGTMQIRHRTLPPADFLYSLEVKRDWQRQVEYLVPPPVAPDLLARIEGLALACYRALGCRDVARVDLRLRRGEPHFIEVNPLPGLSPTYGDLPILAGRMGWTHERLVLEIVRSALARAAPPAAP